MSNSRLELVPLCFSTLSAGQLLRFQELDGVGKKRQRNDENEEEDQSAYGSGGCGIHRRNAKKEDFKEYGTEYRAKVRS